MPKQSKEGYSKLFSLSQVIVNITALLIALCI